ncbi:MAG: amidohydrolase family protein [Ignavibacteria bacterium]|nr:amidohydrolase family protein [Ignavibacteria bacterium]
MFILENAYVLTLNENNDFGRYSILIKDKLIDDIADKSTVGEAKLRKWKESGSFEIIDCTDKLIMPPFVNACLRSEATLIHYLLKKRNYEDTEGDLCTELIFNYLYKEIPGEDTKRDLDNIYKYSLVRNLKSGVLYLNEFSLRKDINHIPYIIDSINITGQRVSVCYPIKQDSEVIRDFKYLNPSYYLVNENHITVYDISQIKELKNHGVVKLFVEAATNKQVTDKFRQIFHKSLFEFLEEYSLIDENTSFINPIYLTYNDLKILTNRNASVIVCPRDLVNFTSRYFPIDDFAGHGIKFSIATGWLGTDLMKELRLLRNKYRELNLSSLELILSVTKIPYGLYFDDSSYYSINPGSRADMIFIDFSDSRFQFFPERPDIEKVCDFIVDNLSSYNISAVMSGGEFRCLDHKLLTADEQEILNNVSLTRTRLYSAGKYEELHLKKVKESIAERIAEKEDEAKLFPDKSEETEEIPKEEFRIKSRISVYRQRKSSMQNSLFDELTESNIIQSDDSLKSPVLNLLISEQHTPADDEALIQTKSVDEIVINKLVPQRSKETQKKVNQESKIELPKDVKLRFGDD